MAGDVSVRAMLVVVLLLLVGPLLEHMGSTTVAAEPISEHLELPGCTTSMTPADEWRPRPVGPDYLLEVRLSCGDATVDATIAQFLHPEQGQEAVSDLHKIVPRSIRFDGAVTQPRYVPFRVNEYVDERSMDDRQLIWSWYSVGETPTPSAYSVKRAQMLDAFALEPRDTSLLILRSSGSEVAILRENLDNTIGPLWDWFLDQRRPR